MKFIPILFSTEMVQAIIDGRKSMTRREVKPQPQFNFTNEKHGLGNGWIQQCPYGKVGDVLWVRETWAKNEQDGMVDYKTDYPSESHFFGWKPSIHMPKTACRIWLQITDIRLERLCDITEEDAIAEGVEKQFSSLFRELRYKDYANVKDNWRSAVSSFQSLWASIKGINSWDDNPWVWVISFKQINKPENFC